MPRLLVVAVLVVTVWLVPARTVIAHPFGPPPTARVGSSGRTVTVDWSATPDDAVTIGERLGLMPEGSVAAYRQEGAAQVAPSARDEARLSASPDLREYLVQHIAVAVDGHPCAADIDTIPDFVHSGARVRFTCGSAVDEATLRITMLHDIHPAYRTVAVGTRTDPAESVFTTAAPEHTWRFNVEPGSSSGVGTGTLLAVGGAAGAALAGAMVVRRRRRR